MTGSGKQIIQMTQTKEEKRERNKIMVTVPWSK
jgi:hypothetical protein